MTPSLSDFNRTGPSEPLDATTYCIIFTMMVFFFWKFQEIARSTPRFCAVYYGANPMESANYKVNGVHVFIPHLHLF